MSSQSYKNQRRFLVLITSLTIILSIGACAKKPRFVLKLPSTVTPPVVYCFDTVGHKPGAKPWILGGTCCCTPSPEILRNYIEHGHVPADTTMDDLIALYKAKDIKTALHHQECNNMCEWGPHVVKGGTCMVPPTPMTQNYEEVFSDGFQKLTEKERRKMLRKRDKAIRKLMK